MRTGATVIKCVHLTKDGRRIPVEIGIRLFTYQGRPTVISVARDISERKKAEARIHHLAHHDTLTALPNRRLLLDRLERAVEAGQRYQRPVAVLMMDLDGFKPVNDVFRHAIGDEVLKDVARRLRATVRRADTVARYGDEFVVLLTELNSPDDATVVASKIIAAIGEPIHVGGQDIRIGVSIGITVFPHGGRSSDEPLKAADAALYAAKDNGRNRYALE